MSADQKKALVKLYFILTLVCLFVIIGMYCIDIYIINPIYTVHPSKFVWFSYLKDIMYGIFTGALTGLIISFYEYRQQIYSDIYLFIRNTRSCISVIEKMLILGNYDLCIFEIDQYNNSIKDLFVIRKLRKNNEQIYTTIKSIKQATTQLRPSIEKINNESKSISRLNKSNEDIRNSFIDGFNLRMSNQQLKSELDKMKKKLTDNEKRLIIMDEGLQVLISQCTEELAQIEDLALSLYNFVNKSRRIFIL